MQALSMLHYAVLFLFGIFVSVAFLGVRFDRKNLLSLSLFTLCIGASLLSIYLLLGESTTEKLYPLIVHLPLMLFLTWRFRQRFPAAMLSVFTAYLCCQVSNWLGAAVQLITEQLWVYFVVRILATAVFGVLILRFPAATLSHLVRKSDKTLLLLAVLPTAYYLFDYTTAVYTDLLYSGNAAVAEFLGFVLCAMYVLFLLQYLRQYEETCETEQRNQLMRMQHAHTEKELEAIRHAEQAVAILRHDMRHFLANVSTLIQSGDVEAAQACICEVVDAVELTATKRYSRNPIIHTILSYHGELMAEQGIAFQYNVQVPERLPLSDVDITSVLSNSLENAIRAVLPLPQEKRYIELDIRMHQEKLLLSVKNTFADEPVFIDGVPQAQEEGHGIGSRSILYVVEKLKGHYQFSVRDGKCVLQVIL